MFSDGQECYRERLDKVRESFHRQLLDSHVGLFPCLLMLIADHLHC